MINNSWTGKRVISYLTNPYALTGVLVCSYLLVAWFLGIYLQFEFLQSDVLGYWKDSLDWQTPFNAFHVPGYPLMIAILRGFTFNALPPVIVMMGINLAAYSISIFLIYRILETAGVDRGIAALGVLLFGLWPFVGLTYTVDPLADLPAISLFLAGVYTLQLSRRNIAALLFGSALITHKALWPAIGLLVAMDLLRHKKYFSKQNMTFLGFTILPIGILWLSGSFYYGSLTWLVSSNTAVEISSRSSLPIFDGLIGTLLAGGVRGIIKGILLMGFAILTVFSLYSSVKQVGTEQNRTEQNRTEQNYVALWAGCINLDTYFVRCLKSKRGLGSGEI